MTLKLPKTTNDELKVVFETRTPTDAMKWDSRQLAKTAQFRRLGWCVVGTRGGRAIWTLPVAYNLF